ncbi:deleted in azoospermia-like [Apteryx rowi]|uniref:deleted in azoospermia-like n=1 Tax=Apteryx rowi TaxID=308060 RepID=UPI000E1DE80D|nr:deleted in azoospermia-like [Apteryx rowi]
MQVDDASSCGVCVTRCRVLGNSPPSPDRPSADAEAQCASISREDNTHLSATSQGYVLPEGKIMPNTVFVGGIDIRMNETEIRSFFARYGTVKEVKIITDRTGVSKGYGFVSFLDNVDVQKIVEVSYLSLNYLKKSSYEGWRFNHNGLLGSKEIMLRLRKEFLPLKSENAIEILVELAVKPLILSGNIWKDVPINSNCFTSLLAVITNPCTRLPMATLHCKEQVYTSVSYHYSEDPEFIQTECAVPEPTQSSSNSPQKRSVDRSIQTVVSCLFNPENRLRNTFVSQEDYFKLETVGLKGLSAQMSPSSCKERWARMWVTIFVLHYSGAEFHLLSSEVDDMED